MRFSRLFLIIAFNTFLLGLISVIALLSPVVPPCLAEGKDATSVKAIQLKQQHFFFGDTELTLSKLGAKVECKGHMQFIVVARAPSWTVTVYRNDDKTYFEESMAQFVDTSLVSGIMLTYRDKDTLGGSRSIPIEVDGFKALKRVDKQAEFIYIPDDHSLPEQVLEFIYAAYKLPTCGGIPLRYVRKAIGRDMITQMDETGHNLIQIKTNSLKNISVPLSFFRAPRGLHKAKSIRDVVLSANKRDESADFQLMFDKTDAPKGPVSKTQH